MLRSSRQRHLQLSPLPEVELHPRLDRPSKLQRRQSIRSRSHYIRRRVVIALKLFDPSQIQPRSRRRIQRKHSTRRRIENRWRLRNPIHRRKVRAHLPCHRNHRRTQRRSAHSSVTSEKKKTVSVCPPLCSPILISLLIHGSAHRPSLVSQRVIFHPAGRRLLKCRLIPEHARTQVCARRLRVIVLLCIRRLADPEQFVIELSQHAPTIHHALHGSQRVIRDHALQTHQCSIAGVPVDHARRSPLDVERIRLRLCRTPAASSPPPPPPARSPR